MKLVRDARWLYEVVVAREELISTAIGNGSPFAPAPSASFQNQDAQHFVWSQQRRVDFDAPDNKPVNIFFMLLLHNDKQHLFSLSYISKLI